VQHRQQRIVPRQPADVAPVRPRAIELRRLGGIDCDKTFNI